MCARARTNPRALMNMIFFLNFYNVSNFSYTKAVVNKSNLLNSLCIGSLIPPLWQENNVFFLLLLGDCIFLF